MARTFVALLMAIVFSIHMLAPSAASMKNELQSLPTLETLFEIDGSADRSSDEPSPVSSHAGTKCHDQCQGFTPLYTHGLVQIRRLPIDVRLPNVSLAFISIVVPPPQRIA
jgi:hypothetical protein